MSSFTAQERLARVEVSLDQLAREARELHADLRESTQLQRTYLEKQELRIRELERNAEQTRTHLRWMKASWAAVQSAVVGWVGLK